MEWNIKSIMSFSNCEYEIEGNDKKIKGVASIKEASRSDLTFCYWEGQKGISLISNSEAGIILCKKIMKGLVHPKSGNQLVFVDNPRFVFVNFVRKNFTEDKVSIISKKASISEKADIGSNCFIGDFVTIGDHCKIGDNTIIYECASLRNCVIHDNCIIHSGVSIGAEGFAFEREPNGSLIRFPHLKGVKISKNVEIGANTSIARGSLTDTTIGEGTKIDVLVHIGHNAVIGKNCIIVSGAVIGGSTKIGNCCWIGINASLKDRIEIGNNVIIGSGSSVISSIKDNDIVAGVPARSIKHKVNSKELFLMASQVETKKNNFKDA